MPPRNTSSPARRPSALVLCACALALVAGGSGAPPTSADTSRRIGRDLVVESLEFGRFDVLPTHQIAFAPGVTRIQQRAQLRGYGWRLKLTSSARIDVEVLERVVLPARPDEWGITSNVTLSFDRTSATTELHMDPREGAFDNTWWFSEGDPNGRYRMEIYVEGAFVGATDFDVY